MMSKSFISILLLVMSCTFTISAQTVTLDYYFNHETRKTASGQAKRFHYLWGDKTDAGFSILGDIFKRNGAKTDTLGDAPTTVNLAKSDIYIIVDPDSRKENPQPHYIQKKDVREIAAWVKKGGVLVLMANDSANTELDHFNGLANQFGLHFNNDLQNHVRDDNHFEDGAVTPPDRLIFNTAGKLFLKDVCSISLHQKQATPVLKAANGANVAVITRYGKGMVFAVGDPWLYNEYVNGRLPAAFDNDKAANDLVVWLIKQSGPAK